MPETVQIEASHHLVELFQHSPLFKTISHHETVAAYYPTKGELSPLPLLESLIQHDMVACLPIIKGKDQPLAFAPWHPEHDMVAGKIYAHLHEPKHDIPDYCEPDMLFVPLLAVDKYGNRLGFGGGYYDRTLAALKATKPHIVTIGVGYHWQLCNEVFAAEPHDVPLDYFLSDKALTAF